MEDKVLSTTKVISVAQDYLILGKSTKETEIRINLMGDDYEASKQKVENVIRLAAYAEAIVAGRVVLPAYEPKNPVKIRMEGDEVKKDG